MEGQLWETPNSVGLAFVIYFMDLFTACLEGDLRPCLDSLGVGVLREMNLELLKEFTMEEVGSAFQQMAPLKASRLDGFTTGFFQNNWPLVGEEVCCVVLDTLNSGIMPNELNLTYLALIPKTESPTTMTEFRPIGLCNVLYKLISKVIANRLKKVLPLIISSNQSTFIPGCLISDNILAAYETFHTMHSSMKGKKGFTVVKLDMSKAYDRVEWQLLEAVMH